MEYDGAGNDVGTLDADVAPHPHHHVQPGVLVQPGDLAPTGGYCTAEANVYEKRCLVC